MRFYVAACVAYAVTACGTPPSCADEDVSGDYELPYEGSDGGGGPSRIADAGAVDVRDAEARQDADVHDAGPNAPAPVTWATMPCEQSCDLLVTFGSLKLKRCEPPKKNESGRLAVRCEGTVFVCHGGSTGGCGTPAVL